ncbi:hypothetical protein [Nocardia sp. NRRL S-836]|uniref:hypothetical protein n=1 Tax=Nocardia sp. NRRL S-836 TaxID=1519492 RepID=UPI0006AF2AD8|nr:hypothetical protein [Nocardia sp. NRRL S-836]
MTGELTGSAPFPSSATVTARLSKGAGTGRGLPDVLGLALRIPTGSGDWDVLLSTSGSGRFSRLLPRFAGRWRGATLGSILPYRHRGELWWLMAVPADAGEPPSRFTVHASGRDAVWRQVAEVRLHDLSDDTPIAFDPVLNRPAEVELAPRWLAALREQAYAGSRRGRRVS